MLSTPRAAGGGAPDHFPLRLHFALGPWHVPGATDLSRLPPVWGGGDLGGAFQTANKADLRERHQGPLFTRFFGLGRREGLGRERGAPKVPVQGTATGKKETRTFNHQDESRRAWHLAVRLLSPFLEAPMEYREIRGER